MLNYHKHLAKVIEEQNKIIEAQGAALRRTIHPADLGQTSPIRTYITAK